MTIKECIELINTTPLLSLSMADNIIQTHIPRTSRKMTIIKSAKYVILSDVYECEDGFIGFIGTFRGCVDGMTSDDASKKCRIKEYNTVKKFNLNFKKYETN